MNKITFFLCLLFVSQSFAQDHIKQELLKSHNKHRESNSLKELQMDHKLNKVAQQHSEWMAKTGNFSHIGENDSTPHQRISSTGYQYRTTRENIAYGNRSVKSVMNIWLNSSGHYNNIMSLSDEIGFGYAVNNQGFPYWTTVFGQSKKLMLSPIPASIPESLNNPNVKPVKELKYFPLSSKDGWEERDPRFNFWLAPSVRIRNGGICGSGTICYYDEDSGYAYVISCGHLFRSRAMTTEQGEERNITVNVDVYYHNKKKLDQPKTYTGEALCYENFRINPWDVALIRFKPDWDIEWYMPIAERNIPLNQGDQFHSLGCDGCREVAHYRIEYIKEVDYGTVTELVSHKNNPRGGRSGGGVMTDEGHLIAICSRGGGGYAYWTSLDQIYKFLEREKKWSFLLDVRGHWAKELPITSINNNLTYDEDYLILP